MLALLVTIPATAVAQPTPCGGDTDDPTSVVVTMAGTPQQSGQALIAAVNNAVATENRPCVVKVEPGIFDVEAAPLQMRAFVDVEGSGVGATVIRGEGPSGPSDGVVLGANGSEIRNLTITCPSTAAGCTGLVNPGSSSDIDNVEIRANTASGDMIGIRNEGGMPVIKNVVITLSDGSGDLIGMLNVDNAANVAFPYARPKLQNVDMTIRRAAAGKLAAGIVLEDTSRLQYMKASQMVVGEGATAVGILARNYDPITIHSDNLPIRDTTISVVNGTTSNIGIDLDNHNLGVDLLRTLINALGSSGIGIKSGKTSGAPITVENSRLNTESAVAAIIGDTVDVSISKICASGIDATNATCNLVVDCTGSPANLNQCP